MPRRYQFVSQWIIPASQNDVWEVLTESHDWPSWWDGVTRVETSGGKQPRIGDRITGTWHALAGYDLRLELVMTTVQRPVILAFTTSGDLEGTGTWSLSETSAGTVIDITWDVITTKQWMNALAPIMGPFFTYSHNRLMAKGEAGLRNRLLT